MEPNGPPRLPLRSLVPEPSGPEAFTAPVTLSSAVLTEIPSVLDRSASNNSLVSVTTLPSVKDGDILMTPSNVDQQTPAGVSPTSALSRLTSTQSKTSSGPGSGPPLNSPDMPTPSSLVSQSTNASGSSTTTIPLNLPQAVLKGGPAILSLPHSSISSLDSSIVSPPSSAFSSPAESTSDLIATSVRSPFPEPAVAAAVATAIANGTEPQPPLHNSVSNDSIASSQPPIIAPVAAQADHQHARSPEKSSPLAVLRSPSLPNAIAPSTQDVPVSEPVLPPVAQILDAAAITNNIISPKRSPKPSPPLPSLPPSASSSSSSAPKGKPSPSNKRSRPSETESINTSLAVSSATDVSETNRKPPAKKPKKKKPVVKSETAKNNGAESSEKSKAKSNGQKKDVQAAANARKRQRPKPDPTDTASVVEAKVSGISPSKAKRVRSDPSTDPSERTRDPTEAPATPSDVGSENGSNGLDSEHSDGQKSDPSADKRKVKRFSNTCPKCSSKFTYPAGREFIRCPHCHEVTHVVDQLAATDENAKQAEEAFYETLSEFKTMFDRSNSALVWLARASPTRSWKFAVPNACRWPKASSGQGGYATAFRKLGLSLRTSDTKSGHWHYWYFEPKKFDFKALQRALQRRWKESPHYNQHLAEAALRRAKEKQKESVDKSLNLSDPANLSEALKVAAASLLSSSINPQQSPPQFNTVPSQVGLPFLQNSQPHASDLWSNLRGGFPPGMTPDLAAALLQSQQAGQPPFQSTAFPSAFSASASPPFGSLNPSILSSLGMNQMTINSLLQSSQQPAQPQAQHPSQSMGGWQPKQSLSADHLAGLSSGLPPADVTMDAVRQRVSPPTAANSDATANKVYQQMLQQLTARQSTALNSTGITGFDIANAQEKLSTPFQTLNTVTNLTSLSTAPLPPLADPSVSIPTPPLQTNTKLPSTAAAGVSSSSSLPPNASAASKALSFFTSMPPEVQQVFLSGTSLETLLAQANAQMPTQPTAPTFRTSEPPHAFSNLNQPQATGAAGLNPYFQSQLGAQGGMGVNPAMFPMLYNQMHPSYLSQLYQPPSFAMGHMDPMSFRTMSGYQTSQARSSLDHFQQQQQQPPQSSLPITNLFASSSADKAAASSNVSVSSTTTAN